jgi:hypothetical protein
MHNTQDTAASFSPHTTSSKTTWPPKTCSRQAYRSTGCPQLPATYAMASGRSPDTGTIMREPEQALESSARPRLQTGVQGGAATRISPRREGGDVQTISRIEQDCNRLYSVQTTLGLVRLALVLIRPFQLTGSAAGVAICRRLGTLLPSRHTLRPCGSAFMVLNAMRTADIKLWRYR